MLGHNTTSGRKLDVVMDRLGEWCLGCAASHEHTPMGAHCDHSSTGLQSVMLPTCHMNTPASSSTPASPTARSVPGRGDMSRVGILCCRGQVLLSLPHSEAAPQSAMQRTATQKPWRIASHCRMKYSKRSSDAARDSPQESPRRWEG